MNYEQWIELGKSQGFVVPIAPKTHNFSVIARFERGLGPEYVNLKPVQAVTIAEAQKQADAQAEIYFMTTDGMEQAVIREIRIRPND